MLTQLPIEFWNVVCEMAPYLLFGFLVAGALSVLIPQETVERHLGGRGILPVLKAAMVGVPLPLCSCGVIPVAASLRRHGASRGATASFLLSTPQTGVDSILVTYSMLGPIMAVFRPVAAFVTGLVGGALEMVLGDDTKGNSGPPPRCEDACCTGGDGHGRIYRALRFGFVTLPRDIAKPLALGVAVSGAISVLVPGDWFASTLGTGIGSMLVMIAVGIPLYVCATGSVPIAAALVAKGISPGAALVFLMTGPATNAATIATVWKTMGRRSAIVYLITVASTALGFGLLFDFLFPVGGGASAVCGGHEMLPAFVKTASAIALLALIGIGWFWPARHDREAHPAAPANGADAHAVTLAIAGMTCSHCAESVQRALRECPGVSHASVDLGKGRATVKGSGLDVGQLRKAVGELGFEAQECAGA